MTEKIGKKSFSKDLWNVVKRFANAKKWKRKKPEYKFNNFSP